MKFRVVFFLLLAQFPTLAQLTPPELVEMGDVCVNEEAYSHARNYYHKALPFFQQENNFERQSYLYLWLSESAYGLGHLQEALQEAETSLSIAAQHLDTTELDFFPMILQNLGVFSSMLGRYDDQMRYYQRSHAAALSTKGFFSEEAASSYFSMGAAFMRRRRWAEAIQYADTSLSISRQLRYHEGEAAALVNLAYAYCMKGDVGKAIDLQMQAIPIIDTPSEKAKAHNNLGTYYIDIGESELALEHLQAALDIRRHLSEANGNDIASTLNNLVRAYSEANDWSEARLYLDSVLALVASDHSVRPSQRQIAFNYQCQWLIHQNRFPEAVQLAEQMLQAQSRNPEIQASTFLILAEAQLGQKKWSAAIQSLQKGFQQLARDYHPTTITDCPSWKQIDIQETGQKLYALYGLAIREMALAQLDINLLQAALPFYQQGDSLHLNSRQSSYYEETKEMLAAKSYDLYAGAIQTLYELYQRTADTSYFNQAFQYSEKTKFLSTLENLNDLYTREFAGVPPDIISREMRLKEEIEFYSNLLRNKAGEPASLIRSWEQAYHAKRKEREQLENEIKTNYKRYYQLKLGLPDVSYDKVVKKLLGPDETLVEYFVNGDQVFAFIIHANASPQLLHWEVADLGGLIIELRNATVGRTPSFNWQSFQAYQQLFQPVQPFVKSEKLAIVNDDLMSYIPFELLLSRLPDPSEKTKPYLIRDYSIRYLFSVNNTLHAWHERARKASQKMVAFAPDFNLIQGTSFSVLPGAKMELDSLKKQFKGRFLYNEQATESNFRKHCTQFSAFHVATHTFINDLVPSTSHLILQADNQQDGYLHAYEMYGLKLETDLIFLSACNTGIGKIKKGEGNASLAQALAYAGCSNLVMSLWQVKDGTTPILVKKYYEYLQSGFDKCEAMRQAKLFYLDENDELFTDPYYWSGFIYSGERTPLVLDGKNQSNASFVFIVGLTILLAIALISLLPFWRSGRYPI
ncbi:MAG TPA: CHAT domain-containing protein [Saprospiraceae bacterium]|nr:CHAT domain-containing protein [Saprospiraceae bacterium]HMQ83691.1 CHAT domain-containing protein [Saprospiraceae bacterium]